MADAGTRDKGAGTDTHRSAACAGHRRALYGAGDRHTALLLENSLASERLMSDYEFSVLPGKITSLAT